MFIRNPHGSEAIQALATQLGVTFGETLSYNNKFSQSGRAGVVGNTFDIKDDLKAAGARWDGENKAWTFADWAACEAALLSIINK